MSHSSPIQNPHKQKSFIKTIAVAGFIAGTLDIAAALIMYQADTGKNPLIILKFIAGGIFGKAAFTGGIAMIIWGFIFHYTIAYLFIIFLFIIYPKLKLLQQHTLITAVIYGTFIWLVMNLIVLPLSNLPAQPFNLINAVRSVAVLILCVGLPASSIVKKYYKTNNSNS